MNLRHLALLLGLGLSVAGCGPSAKQGGEVRSALLSGALGLFTRTAEAPPDPRQLLTRELLNTSQTPLLMIGFELDDNYFTLAPAGQNGSVIHWATGDGSTLSFDTGFLIATRGLGFDLMTADIGPLLSALRGQAAPTALVRIHRRLDGESQTETRSFVCDLRRQGAKQITLFDRSYTTQHVQEDCAGAETSFVNEYWIDASGVIRKSRQWLGTELGMLDVQLLVD